MSVFRDFEKNWWNLRAFISKSSRFYNIETLELLYPKFRAFIYKISIIFFFIYIISKPSRFYNIETLELLYQNPRAFNAFTGFIVISFLEKLQGSALLRIEFAWSWGNSDYINMYYNIPPFKTKIIKALLFKNKR